MNCLIGAGDTGKSTILDALDLVLGARRNVTFNDADFHCLDVDDPIEITATVGQLDDDLKSLEAYGHYLRGYDEKTREIHDEPVHGCEVVLTIALTVGADLEPLWTLWSERMADEGPRYLAWADRVRLSPTRLGAQAQQHLGWRRGSVLNKLSDEKADAGEALAMASRQARQAFGEIADDQLAKTLGVVGKTAASLGVKTGEKLRAMLDAESVSFGGGTISVHDERGVPLSGLGTGSSRLLVAGLQREAGAGASVILVDELEHGLEPHRIMRLVSSLGAREKVSPVQTFVTTHSPVAIREMRHEQLGLLRVQEGVHYVVDIPETCQGTLRVFPEAFLASSILVCEGASEVGFIRGLDRFLLNRGKDSFFADGLALVDAGGCSKIYSRALPMLSLGFRTAVLRDDDKQPKADDEGMFEEAGRVFKWRDDHSIEDELFRSLAPDAVMAMVDRAVELKTLSLVQDHVKSASDGKVTLDDCRVDLNAETRAILGKAAGSGEWFKRFDLMEDLVLDIVAPAVHAAEQPFKQVVKGMVEWIRNGPR